MQVPPQPTSAGHLNCPAMDVSPLYRSARLDPAPRLSWSPGPVPGRRGSTARGPPPNYRPLPYRAPFLGSHGPSGHAPRMGRYLSGGRSCPPEKRRRTKATRREKSWGGRAVWDFLVPLPFPFSLFPFPQTPKPSWRPSTSGIRQPLSPMQSVSTKRNMLAACGMMLHTPSETPSPTSMSIPWHLSRKLWKYLAPRCHRSALLQRGITHNTPTLHITPAHGRRGPNHQSKATVPSGHDAQSGGAHTHWTWSFAHCLAGWHQEAGKQKQRVTGST